MTRFSQQLEFNIEKQKAVDRNYHLGGRSFYFFDLDDNVIFLSTPILLFHKKRSDSLIISSGEFAVVCNLIGKEGAYKNYRIDWDDAKGSFKYFRDVKLSIKDRFTRKKQRFIEDILAMLKTPDKQWQGPSWPYFFYATFNKRPISIITARGHNEKVLKQGINMLVKCGYLKRKPNYLCVLPVTNYKIRRSLGDKECKMSVAELKKLAIRLSVEKALKKYGLNPHHRFGMSDDDPQNINLIIEEMTLLKKKYPDMSFFVIETSGNKCLKREIFLDHIQPKVLNEEEQLALF